MASVECRACELAAATVKCGECKMPLCGNCVASCETCEKPLCPRHVKRTSRGRKLCKTCREERRAARHERKEAKEAAAVAPSEELGEKPDPEKNEVLSFASLEGQQEDKPEAPGKDVKELDKKRPILKQSGYQPPSRKAYTAAFLFFGTSLVLVFLSVPDFREIMWPFESQGTAEFNEQAEIMMKDTNALRDASNVSQLDFVKHLFFFTVAWAFFLAYLYGVARIMIPVAGVAIPRLMKKITFGEKKEYF